MNQTRKEGFGAAALISEDDVASLRPDYRTLVEKLAKDLKGARELPFVPKTTLNAPDGGYFQSLSALLPSDGRACLKWVSVSPKSNPSVKATIILSSLESGETQAIIQASVLTTIRTAVMTYLAALTLGASEPEAIGFIGAGNQALAHLDIFASLNPLLKTVHVFSENNASLDRFTGVAKNLGLNVCLFDDPEQVVRHSDVLISSVPSATVGAPFLDTRWLKPRAFVSMVDIGRSWTIRADDFDAIYTDDVRQSAILSQGGYFPKDVRFSGDLYTMTDSVPSEAKGGRNCFLFGGIPIADASVASAIYDIFKGQHTTSDAAECSGKETPNDL